MLEPKLPSPAPHQVWVWRHPRAEGAAGHCIGVTDLPVHARRAKRLARRIQKAARRHVLPRIVYTSPLQRGAAVGRWLRRWGWAHVIDPALLEMDFGHWEGRPWADIAKAEIDDWCTAFAGTAPGGGESLAAVLERAACWRPKRSAQATAVVVVGHAGWMLARRWRHNHGATLPDAADWPAAPPHGTLWLLPGVQAASSE